MKKLLKSKAGFTIIEVILASIILIISILGGTAFFSINRKSLVFANRQRLATWAAVYKIEQLKSATYTDTTHWDPILNNTPSAGTNEPPLTISGKSFTRKTTITDKSGYKEITVEMGWPGTLTLKPFPVSLTTYISAK